MDSAGANFGAAGALRPCRSRVRPWRRDGGKTKSIIAPALNFRSAVASRTLSTLVVSTTLGISSRDSAGYCGDYSSRRFVGSRDASSGDDNCLSAAGKRRSLSARRRRYAIVTATREEWENPVEPSSQKWTLEQLDEQLRILQEAESSASRRASDERTIGQRNEADADETRTPPQWPEFSFGFVAFAGIGLMILTIVNNTLYRVFFGTPFVERRPVPANSAPPRPAFRVTSLEQEREARRLRDQQREQMAVQTREAPSVK